MYSKGKSDWYTRPGHRQPQTPHLCTCALSNVTSHLPALIILNPSTTCPLDGAAPTAVLIGVLLRVGAADLLCAMWACTRCPAASALHKLNSPAKTLAATIRANRRAFSPGVVGWAPRTPRRSSMADWGSRTVPPPIVPTSIDGIETEIWSAPLKLVRGRVLVCGFLGGEREGGDELSHHGDAVAASNVLCRVLACGQEDRSDDVGSVSIETSNAAGHGTPD